MRKALFNLVRLAALPLAVFVVTAPVLATGEDIKAAPDVPKGDRVRTARPLKLIPQTPEELRAELKQLQTEVLVKPNDAQLHFKLAESYRKTNDNARAAAEYAKAISCDQNLWVAYHQLCATSNDEKQLDQAIEKLTKLETERPKELLLRVALSELYEKRGNYYQAARTLIDLTYANAVPEKYRVKVNARIHSMLVMTKQYGQQPQQQQPEETAATAAATGSEEDMDIMPAPLPTQGTRRSLAQAKIKDAKEVRGMGHTPLLP